MTKKKERNDATFFSMTHSIRTKIMLVPSTSRETSNSNESSSKDYLGKEKLVNLKLIETKHLHFWHVWLRHRLLFQYYGKTQTHTFIVLFQSAIIVSLTNFFFHKTCLYESI